MGKQSIFFLPLLCVLLFTGCTGEKSGQPQAHSIPGTAVLESKSTISPVPINSLGIVEISFPFTRQGGTASNQFAVWIEDGEGNFVKTLYVTDFTAQGGYKSRKEALPTWVKKSKIAGVRKNDIDAVSGATPKTGNLTYIWNCTDQNGKPVPKGQYRFFAEGTLFWESGVLYSGTIPVGETQKSNITAAVEYSAKDEKNKNMIGAVTAVYIPGERKE